MRAVMLVSVSVVLLATLGPLVAHGAPATPAISVPAAGALVPGVFTASGTAAPAAFVEVYEGTSRIGRTQANARGMWRTEVGLISGTHDIAVRAVDQNQVPSPLSAPRTIVVDAERPSVVIATPDESTFSAATSGASIFGTAADRGPAGSAGVATVELRYFEAATRLLVRTETATCSPACPAESIKWMTNVGLLVGTYRVEVRAVDVAGNLSQPASIVFTQAGATQIEASCRGEATLADGGSCSEVFLLNGSRYVSTIGTNADFADVDARGTLILSWFDAADHLVATFGCTGVGVPDLGVTTRTLVCTQHGPARSEYTPGLQRLAVSAFLTDCPADSCAFRGKIRLGAETDLI